LAISGWKLLLKVSGQRMTGGRSPLRSGRLRNHVVKVSAVKAGILRFCEMPPAHFMNCDVPGARPRKFTSHGAMRAMPAQR
jgi:hypothetical protein